jgi:hypothetical protein
MLIESLTLHVFKESLKCSPILNSSESISKAVFIKTEGPIFEIIVSVAFDLLINTYL